ncbi:MAG: tRNA (cytidine(34)-2'-O)-methyltransferase [Bacteriovoracaceae bacterium]|nr:tRNA (cytidine(34)-2'-O)-methyltransferase [Bacteriovoracaceae bacterium]
MLNIVLVAPEIPGNTGSIGRTCLALGASLCLIKPYGFDLSEKAVRRAGLDYWKYLKVKEFENFADFLEKENPSNNSLFFFSKKAEKNYFSTHYPENCYLIFGSETKGLPEDFFVKYSENFLSIPMFSDKVRSLNLSNAVTAVAYEVLRQKLTLLQS